MQRLQLEKFGLCVSVKTGMKGFLDIYIAIVLSFILFGLSFLTSLIHSPITFHREAVYSLRAITVTMLPISSLYIVLPFLEIYVKLKNLEPILWIRFIADVCLPILILLILFGSSVSDDDNDYNWILIVWWINLITDLHGSREILCEVKEGKAFPRTY